MLQPSPSIQYFWLLLRKSESGKKTFSVCFLLLFSVFFRFCAKRKNIPQDIQIEHWTLWTTLAQKKEKNERKISIPTTTTGKKENCYSNVTSQAYEYKRAPLLLTSCSPAFSLWECVCVRFFCCAPLTIMFFFVIDIAPIFQNIFLNVVFSHSFFCTRILCIISGSISNTNIHGRCPKKKRRKEYKRPSQRHWESAIMKEMNERPVAGVS